ncbi:MAG: glycosyltransferase WbuB, partial [Parabacteroides sp.]|nr:glycosyltransferase WbuB [Parabacteroides sp.]
MNILVFSAYYTPEVAASIYFTENILKGMVKDGHFIEMYVPTPTRGISEEIRKDYKKRKKEALHGGHLIINRMSLYGEGKNSILRAIRYLLMNFLFIWKSLFVNADVIFVQSTPPTQGLMAVLIKKVRGFPIVYNLQDIFPDSLVSTGLTKKNSLLWKVGRIIEDFTYRNVDKI